MTCIVYRSTETESKDYGRERIKCSNISVFQSTFGELHTGNSAKSSQFSEQDITSVASEMCSTYLRNLKIGLSEEFKHRYRIVKYEDVSHLARHPGFTWKANGTMDYSCGRSKERSAPVPWSRGRDESCFLQIS